MLMIGDHLQEVVVHVHGGSIVLGMDKCKVNVYYFHTPTLCTMQNNNFKTEQNLNYSISKAWMHKVVA